MTEIRFAIQTHPGWGRVEVPGCRFCPSRVVSGFRLKAGMTYDAEETAMAKEL